MSDYAYLGVLGVILLPPAVYAFWAVKRARDTEGKETITHEVNDTCADCPINPCVDALRNDARLLICPIRTRKRGRNK